MGLLRHKARVRKRRVIDQLRENYPGEWVWDGPEVPNRWHSATMTVTAYSASAFTYDGDDGTFRTEYLDQDGNEILLDRSFMTYQV
jgi:hypothetical protein